MLWHIINNSLTFWVVIETTHVRRNTTHKHIQFVYILTYRYIVQFNRYNYIIHLNRFNIGNSLNLAWKIIRIIVRLPTCKSICVKLSIRINLFQLHPSIWCNNNNNNKYRVYNQNKNINLKHTSLLVFRRVIKQNWKSLDNFAGIEIYIYICWCSSGSIFGSL